MKLKHLVERTSKIILKSLEYMIFLEEKYGLYDKNESQMKMNHEYF